MSGLQWQHDYTGERSGSVYLRRVVLGGSDEHGQIH